MKRKAEKPDFMETSLIKVRKNPNPYKSKNSYKKCKNLIKMTKWQHAFCQNDGLKATSHIIHLYNNKNYNKAYF